ncbi:MAG: 2-oxoacid ferredoxin oxidoreductase, partial [Halanaerobiales bacterium]
LAEEEEDYDETDYELARKKGDEWGEKIPLGVIYREEKEIFRDNFSFLGDEPPVEQETNPRDIKPLLEDLK